MSDLQSYLEPNRWTYRHVGHMGAPGEQATAPEPIEPGAFTAETGLFWQSESFPSQAYEWFALSFQARAEQPAYWAATFFNDDGEMIVPDHYGGIDPSADWADYGMCFRGKVGAMACRLRFHAFCAPAHFRRPRLRRVSRQEVHRWADELWDRMPDMDYDPPAARFEHLSLTAEKLRLGQQLKIVFLGDSVVNDFGSGPVDVLIEEQYENASIQAVTSVTSGGNCQRYAQEGNVQRFLLSHTPDLVIIGGISHQGDVEPIRDVIAQARQQRPDLEFLLTTPAPMPVVDPKEEKAAEQQAAWENWPEKLAELAGSENVACLDLTGLAASYLAANDLDARWLLRDSHHANHRGRQLLARILERHFAQ